MIHSVQSTPGALTRAVAFRGAGLFAVWLAIAGAAPADLPVGVVVAAGGLVASLVLLPPRASRIRPVAMLHLLLRLLWLSVVAGADVARRALGPGIRLDPGYVRYRPRIAPGPARNVFTSLMSVVPGTVPAGSDADGTIIVHCLDRAQPVAASMARDEALFRRALGEADAEVPGDG
ncbi:MAG: Na+/H+ antiporter subunit E [Acetobacteraceae bacterium]